MSNLLHAELTLDNKVKAAFCDLMTLTYDLENQYGSVLTQNAYVCHISWRCVDAFVSYAWSSIRTDTQTDKPSDEYTCQNASNKPTAVET